jgi:hypothetical protein
MARISTGFKPLLALALLASVTAIPATAEVFHVQLKNGGIIDTLKQPEQSSWDAGVVLLLTEYGNWIGLDQKDIEVVTAESSTSGFGIPINTTTIAIGWAPNDAVDPNAPAADGSKAGTSSPAAQQSAAALEAMYKQQEAQSHYTIQQGVSTEQTQGIPSAFVSPSTTPIIRPQQ